MMALGVCVCVCVCVWERWAERDRDRDRDRGQQLSVFDFFEVSGSLLCCSWKVEASL